MSGDRREFGIGKQQPGFQRRLIPAKLTHPRALATDSPYEWPQFGEVEIQEPGRDWFVTSVNTGTKTFVVSGEARDFVIAGDTLVARDCGGANGSYTVVSVAYASGLSSIVVSETVPAATLGAGDYDSRLTTDLIRPARFQTHDVLSIDVAGRFVTIAPPSTSASWPNGSWADYDSPVQSNNMFLRTHRVLWEGCAADSNNGLRTCWASYETVSPSVQKVFLNGSITATGGALGTITWQVPPPWRYVRRALADLRLYLGSVQPEAIVYCQSADGDEWMQIIAADYGPSAPPGEGE